MVSNSTIVVLVIIALAVGGYYLYGPSGQITTYELIAKDPRVVCENFCGEKSASVGDARSDPTRDFITCGCVGDDNLYAFDLYSGEELSDREMQERLSREEPTQTGELTPADICEDYCTNYGTNYPFRDITDLGSGNYRCLCGNGNYEKDVSFNYYDIDMGLHKSIYP